MKLRTQQNERTTDTPRIPNHARAPNAYPAIDAATVPGRSASNARPSAMLDRLAAERRSMTTAATTTPDTTAIHSTRRSFALRARTAPNAIGARPKRIDRRRVTPGNMGEPGSPDYGEGSA